MNKHINRAFYFQNPDSDSILYNNVNWKKTDLFNNFTNICHKCIKPKCKYKERYLSILLDKPSSTKTYFLFRLPVVLAVMQLLTLQKPLLAVVVL